MAQQKLPPALRGLRFLTAGVALGDETGFLAFFTVAKKKKTNPIPRILPVSVCWLTDLMTRSFPVQLWPSFYFTNPMPELMWYGVCPLTSTTELVKKEGLTKSK